MPKPKVQTQNRRQSAPAQLPRASPRAGRVRGGKTPVNCPRGQKGGDGRGAGGQRGITTRKTKTFQSKLIPSEAAATFAEVLTNPEPLAPPLPLPAEGETPLTPAGGVSKPPAVEASAYQGTEASSNEVPTPKAEVFGKQEPVLKKAKNKTGPFAYMKKTIKESIDKAVNEKLAVLVGHGTQKEHGTAVASTPFPSYPQPPPAPLSYLEPPPPPSYPPPPSTFPSQFQAPYYSGPRNSSMPTRPPRFGSRRQRYGSRFPNLSGRPPYQRRYYNAYNGWNGGWNGYGSNYGQDSFEYGGYDGGYNQCYDYGYGNSFHGDYSYFY